MPCAQTQAGEATGFLFRGVQCERVARCLCTEAPVDREALVCVELVGRQVVGEAGVFREYAFASVGELSVSVRRA